MISKVTGPRENEMTTARHILSLLKSHIAGDEDRFLATAMQLAVHEARRATASWRRN